MRSCLALVCAIGLVTALVPAQRAKSKPGIERDWAAIPVSALRQKISEACSELCTQTTQTTQTTDITDITDTKFVITPFQCNDSKVNSWRIETFVYRLVQRDLEQRGLDIVDVAPFLADVRKGLRKPKKKSRRSAAAVQPLPKLRYTSKLIGRAAATTGATVVVVGTCTFGGRTSQVTLRFYGGSPRKRLASKKVSVVNSELALLSNTPPTNRKVIQWVEQHMGEKIDRGECWDLANRAFVTLGIRRAGGSTKWGELIAPGDAILPGDIIQWNRKETGGRQHTVVVYDVLRFGRISVLHQNWAGGAERGRVVGTGSYVASGLKGARIYRPIPPKLRP